MVFRMIADSSTKSNRTTSEGVKPTLLSRVTALTTRTRSGGRKRSDSVPSHNNARPLSVLVHSLPNPLASGGGGVTKKDSKVTIFGTDLYHDDFVSGRIAHVAEDFHVIHLELEEMIVRRDANFFEALGNLFRDDYRVWSKVKFRDSMTITTYEEYRSMKLSLMSSLASAKEKEVPVAFQAKVRFFKKMGSTTILNSLNELLSDTSIKNLVLSGDLIGSDSSDAAAWEKLAEMLHTERWERLNINLFYDLNESHPVAEKPWLQHLEKTISTLEEKFCGGKKLMGRNILPGNAEWADFIDAMASADLDSVRTGALSRRSFNDSNLIESSIRDLVSPENRKIKRDEVIQENSMGQILEDVEEDLGYEEVLPRTLRRSQSFDESTRRAFEKYKAGEDADLKSDEQKTAKEDNATHALKLPGEETTKEVSTTSEEGSKNDTSNGTKSIKKVIKRKKKKKSENALSKSNQTRKSPTRRRLPERSMSHDESKRKITNARKHSSKSPTRRRLPERAISHDESKRKISKGKKNSSKSSKPMRTLPHEKPKKEVSSSNRRDGLQKSLSHSSVRVCRGVELLGGSEHGRRGRPAVRVKLNAVKSKSPNFRKAKTVSPNKLQDDLKSRSCHEPRHMEETSGRRAPRRFAKIRDPTGDHISERIASRSPSRSKSSSKTKTH